MRLTEKEEGIYYLKHKSMGSQSLLDMHQTQLEVNAGINKLGELEDIEEELGIDLIIFMRILRQMDAQDFKPVEKLDKDWIATPYQNVRYFIDLKEQKLIEHGREEHVLNFKDYGKKWALTKKELK